MCLGGDLVDAGLEAVGAAEGDEEDAAAEVVGYATLPYGRWCHAQRLRVLIVDETDVAARPLPDVEGRLEGGQRVGLDDGAEGTQLLVLDAGTLDEGTPDIVVRAAVAVADVVIHGIDEHVEGDIATIFLGERADEVGGGGVGSVTGKELIERGLAGGLGVLGEAQGVLEGKAGGTGGTLLVRSLGGDGVLGRGDDVDVNGKALAHLEVEDDDGLAGFHLLQRRVVGLGFLCASLGHLLLGLIGRDGLAGGLGVTLDGRHERLVAQLGETEHTILAGPGEEVAVTRGEGCLPLAVGLVSGYGIELGVVVYLEFHGSTLHGTTLAVNDGDGVAACGDVVGDDIDLGVDGAAVDDILVAMIVAEDTRVHEHGT